MKAALTILTTTLILLAGMDVLVAVALNWAEKEGRLGSLVRYFEYGRSVPGKLERWIDNPDIAGNLYKSAWRGNTLVGGLYGVSLGGVFFGESMFALAPDASKIAFVTLLGNLHHWGFSLVDCQVPTEHLERFGAEAWPRHEFLSHLETALEKPTKRGPWSVSLPPTDAVARVMQAAGEDGDA